MHVIVNGRFQLLWTWDGTERFAWGKRSSIFPEIRAWRIGPLCFLARDAVVDLDQTFIEQRNSYARKWLAMKDRERENKALSGGPV